MRILHIGDEMAWRGGENQVRFLIEGLKSRGVASFAAYPLGSRAFERFQAMVPTFGWVSRSPYDPRNILGLVRFCREHKIEILNSHSSKSMSLALAVKTWLPYLKLVAHRRVAFAIKENWLTRRKYESSKIDKFVCISNAIADVVRAYRIPETKIAVVRSAVDETAYQALDKVQAKKKIIAGLRAAGALGENADVVIIGNASALTSEKGHEMLIAACADLRDRGLPFHCLIAGDGALEDQLKRMVANLNLRNHVSFLGHIRDVGSFLAALDVLVFPSSQEGLGTILLDAALAGCALVGTRTGGIPEVIVHEQTGLLVGVGAAPALAKELETLIADPGFLSRLARQAREHVRREFSLTAMVYGNLQIYKQLLDE